MIIDFSKIDKYQGQEITLPLLGAKNTILPLLFLCAGICYKDKKDITLKNIPSSSDVKSSIEMLIGLGFSISMYEDKNELTIDGKNTKLTNIINEQLYEKIRYSILLLGLLLSFFDEVSIPMHTGGCNIQGERKNDIHYDFFEKVGHDIIERSNKIIIKRNKNIDHRSIEYKMKIESTSVSENVLLYCLLNYDKYDSIEVGNFYGNRPDIKELMNVCSLFGYDIQFSSEERKFLGIKYKSNDIKSLSYFVLSDFDQLLFYIFISLLAKQKIIINKYNNNYPYMEISLIEKLFGNIITRTESNLIIDYSNLSISYKDSINLIASVYPDIMSDSLPILSLIILFYPLISLVDNRFPDRYKYIEYYKDLGLDSNIVDGNTYILSHSKGTVSKQNFACDPFDLFSIRESGLLLLLGIYTKKKLIINNFSILKRGYHDIENVLKLIGASYEY